MGDFAPPISSTFAHDNHVELQNLLDKVIIPLYGLTAKIEKMIKLKFLLLFVASQPCECLRFIAKSSMAALAASHSVGVSRMFCKQCTNTTEQLIALWANFIAIEVLFCFQRLPALVFLLSVYLVRHPPTR